jgi:TolB protein
MQKSKYMCRRALVSGLFLFFTQPMLFSQAAERALTNNSGDNRHPWWSPNGEQLVFESSRDGDWELFIIDRDGSSEEQLTINNYEDRNPSWHPNGDKILFESNRSGNFSLYVLNLYDRSVEPITLEDFHYEPTTARYSPDGKYIAFSADAEPGEAALNLYKTSAEGGKVEQLTTAAYRSFYGAWSPDSQQLVFFSRRDTRGEQDELYIMNIDEPDSLAKRISTYPENDFCPHWSADGSRLVFSRSIPDDRPELFISNTDGTGVRQLTFTPQLGETQAVWSPDGKSIAYAGYRNGSYQICTLAIQD